MVEIGGIKIDVPLALAPMAGVTDLAFRTICREQGAGLTCTEMVSAKALCFQDKKSIPLLQLGEGEHPAAAQIFGSDLVCMEEAAAIAHEVSGADLIDINMGCPVPKVANSGDGSGLMRDPDKAVRVLEAVVRGAGWRRNWSGRSGGRRWSGSSGPCRTISGRSWSCGRCPDCPIKRSGSFCPWTWGR